MSETPQIHHTMKQGSAWRVLVDGSVVSEHRELREALQESSNQALSDPGATVEAKREARVRTTVSNVASPKPEPDPDPDPPNDDPIPLPDNARIVHPAANETLTPRTGTEEEPLVYMPPNGHEGRLPVADIRMNWGKPVRHVWFVGIEFHGMELRGIGGTQIRDVTFLDCSWPKPGGGGDVQGDVKRVRFVRCQFGPRLSGRHQGVFLGGIDGLAIRDSVFDRIGTHNQEATSDLGHSLYLTNCSNVLIEGNVLARDGLSVKLNALATGASRNITIRGNLWFGSAKAVVIGSNNRSDDAFEDITISGNVVWAPGRIIARGEDLSNRPIMIAGGVNLAQTVGCVIEGNLLAQNPEGGRALDMHPNDDSDWWARNVEVRNNTLANWQPSDAGSWVTAGESVTLEGNTSIDQPNRTLSEYVAQHGHDSVEAWLEALMSRSRGEWSGQHSGGAVVEYLTGAE